MRPAIAARDADMEQNGTTQTIATNVESWVNNLCIDFLRAFVKNICQAIQIISSYNCMTLLYGTERQIWNALYLKITEFNSVNLRIWYYCTKLRQ